MPPTDDAELHPTWGGINFRTAENVCFATPEQLLHDYQACAPRYDIPPGVFRAWMLHSYSGEAAPDGIPDGQGNAMLCGNMKYEGGFKRGLMHGQGKLEFGPGSAFEGGFFCNCLYGPGKYTWPMGASFVGEVFDGLFHGGTGTLDAGEDGSMVFEGSWLHGLRHGQGRLTCEKEGGSVYNGGWQNDQKHGDGNLVYTSGSTYRGGWFEGKKHGQGRATLVVLAAAISRKLQKHWRLDAETTQIYEGEWSKDVPHGSGKDIWADDGVEKDRNILRNTYTGGFSQGKRDGHGSYVYSSGAVFKGVWKDGMKDGQGALYYEDGAVHSGDFYRDRYVPVKGVTAFPVFEPMDPIVEVDSNVQEMKPKLTQILLRNNITLRKVFLAYSFYQWKPLGNPLRYLGRPRAMVLEQFWQLCHDSRMVEPDFGLAQIDYVLRAGPDCAITKMSEVHSPSRQILYREFFESCVKLSRYKIKGDMPLDARVDAFLQAFVLGLEEPGKESLYTLVGSKPVQAVLDEFRPQLNQLLNETLREVGTSDETLKFSYLNMFVLRFAPDLVAEQAQLLIKVMKALYYVELKEEDDNSAFLDSDLNFRECELCLLVIAMEDKSAPAREAQDGLAAVLKNVVIPNLATNLETLLNEPIPPPAPKKK